MKQAEQANTSAEKAHDQNSRLNGRAPSGHGDSNQAREMLRTIGNRNMGRFLQAKLKVSEPSDPSEVEADSFAEKILRMPGNGAGHVARPGQVPAEPAISRACSQCEEEKDNAGASRDEKLADDDNLHLMAKRSFGHPSVEARSGIGAAVNLISSGVDGKQLGRQEREFFEPRIGFDLGSVRVHVGETAARSAEGVGALAYTVGRNIVFGAGQYAPESHAGKTLLAHELAHVLQQDQSGLIQRKNNATLVHERISSSETTLSRQVAPAPANLNYDNLADRVHEAVEGGWFFGLGTDEEQVYLALQPLQRNQTAIDQLKTTYLNKFHVTLEAAIRGDFSGEELEYALQLINLGTPGAAQSVHATPSSSADIELAAKRIRKAVEGLGTDEEAIYAVLMPFNRDMQLIHELMLVYQWLYTENLRERIIEEMSGSELDYALYLMGGPAIRANVEITEVTEAESIRLFGELAGLGFWTTTDRLAPIPFHYPPDGCYSRAHLMADRLTELGYASEKVFAVSNVGAAGLNVHSNFAADVGSRGFTVSDPLCGGTTSGTQYDPLVRWWYHVAPVIRVRTALGTIVEKVMDPSLAHSPITINDWTGLMGPRPLTRLPLGDVERLLEANRGRFPSSSELVYTTDRDVFWPGGPFNGPDPERAGADMEGTRKTITEYSSRASAHELADRIRLELQSGVVNLPAILTLITAATSDARMRLRRCFPNLIAELDSRIGAADVARVTTELNRP